MRTNLRTSLPVFLLVLALLACASPQIVFVDPNAGATSVAQTVDAIMQLTQAAGNDVVVVASDTPTLVPSPTPTSTVPPATFTLPPTLTPTFTFTPTLYISPTPIFPVISVSVPTNCRLGPGKVYEQVGALLVGRTVQVYARSSLGNYWYIRNPDRPQEYCWVWGEYATLTGLVSALPVFTPPPSPTPTLTPTPSPAFDISYAGLDSCSAAWWVDVDLRNTGLITFQSVSMVVKDTATSTTFTAITDGFTDKTGCDSSLRKVLLPDKHAITSLPAFPYDPTGHKLRATLTLCSNTGLNGTCATETLVVTP